MITEDGALIIDTPEGIAAYRLLALKGALKMELLGIRFYGGRKSAAALVRRELAKAGVEPRRTRVKLLAQYEQLLREKGVLRD